MGRIRKFFSKTQHSIKPKSAATTPVSPLQNTAQSETSAPEHNTPLLETFPAEIRRHLLSNLDYEGLKALVHASPVYHQQYLLDRQNLLCACLEATLGSSTTIDACAVYHSSLINSSETRTKETITQFLESYRDKLSNSFSPYSLLKALTLDEVISIVTFHISIIRPLTQYYTSWTMDNLAKETTDLHSHVYLKDYEPLSLSKIENTRLVRALYRFQLYCNLFGFSQYWYGRQRLWMFSKVDILKIFICIYEPWEVEEIACIYAFVREKFSQAFDNIYRDVHQDNPRFEEYDRQPTPRGAFGFDYLNRGSLLEGTLTRGLGLLHDILFTIKDHEHLALTMQEKIKQTRVPDLEGTLNYASYNMLHRSDRDLKQERRDPFPFQGDHEDLPPLAWALMWQGTYSNLLAYYYINDKTRFWGYIMWDAARLERTGAKETLARQLQFHWQGYDPRDGNWQF